MKTMISKYPGTCAKCGGTFARGSTINWFGRGHAEHQTCGETYHAEENPVVAPCWICKAPAGKFRNLGPATPVWCDDCFTKELAKTFSACNVRFTKPSEFVPDSFDMQVEDNMRDACGL